MNQTHSPLHTDFYQLSMAYGYWRLNKHNQEAAFYLSYRSNPFGGSHAIYCGLNSVIDFLSDWHFKAEDIHYLSTLKNSDGSTFFEKKFLDYLCSLKFSCSVYAMKEGEKVFPNLPLLRVEGPLLQCQLIETALLNFINFQTLIATKAERICRAAQGDPVIEFGMRRAQGSDGAISASRAAYIGGCVATSNVAAGKLFDIPVRGTHAHSWVSAFDTEQNSFDAYANIMPKNCVLLVDTYDTLQGVKNAIKTGKILREQGEDLSGIRLDSGDMVTLSIEARKLLDDAGFQQTFILASNSLDEYSIAEMKKRGAKINAWGVGTHLATAYDQPALDGVYKLSALKNAKNDWENKIKLSEDDIKISIPGRQQVRRLLDKENNITDVIYDLTLGMSDEVIFKDQKIEKISQDERSESKELLVPIFEKGVLVYQSPTIHETRAAVLAQESEGKNRVGIEKALFLTREELVGKLKG